jgi:ferredoxin-NADP reductase
VKCVEKGSTFKEALAHLSAGDKVTTGIVMGDFLLPADTTKKILFIAGGIGITPFVSMIRTCLLRHEKRNIILLYANKTKEDIAYMDIIAQAERECDMRTVHVLSEEKEFFKDEQHIIGGFITEEMIQKYVPDIVERDVYISGPPQMVARYEDVVKKMGVSREAVVTDFFPGFA